MSTESTVERDARLVNARDHDVDPSDIAVGVVIGRTSEFFDFFVFAIASVIVFPQRVFPFVDPLTGTLYCFAIFAVAFAARPFGTAIFMAVDRAYGKGAKLTTSLFLLGTATVALGFLPAYDVIGIWSVVVLVALRIVQGIAVAGSWDGLASLLALNAPAERRGWYAMVPQIGAPFGLIVASGLYSFLVGFLSADDFYDWGWRYPFFVAFAINVVALFARLRIVVTPEYTKLFDADELRPTPLAPTLRATWRTIAIGAFAPLATFALFHMVTVFPLSWIYLYTSEATWRFLALETVGALVCAAAIVASGVIADRIGRRRLLAWCAIAIGVYSVLSPTLLDLGFFGEAAFMGVGFVLLGLSFGQASGAVAGGFAQPYRYTGSALTSDLSWLFGAGFAPLVALWVSANYGLVAAGLYMLSGCVCTLVALRYSKRWRLADAVLARPAAPRRPPSPPPPRA